MVDKTDDEEQLGGVYYNINGPVYVAAFDPIDDLEDDADGEYGISRTRAATHDSNRPRELGTYRLPQAGALSLTPYDSSPYTASWSSGPGTLLLDGQELTALTPVAGQLARCVVADSFPNEYLGSSLDRLAFIDVFGTSDQIERVVINDDTYSASEYRFVVTTTPIEEDLVDQSIVVYAADQELFSILIHIGGTTEQALMLEKHADGASFLVLAHLRCV